MTWPEVVLRIFSGAGILIALGIGWCLLMECSLADIISAWRKRK